MAESKNGWFNSWLSAARNKSTEVLEFVKKDLEEFGNTVKNEATNVVSSTGSAISKTLKLNESESTASSMKRSISSFLGQMNSILNPVPDDSDTEAIIITENADPVALTRVQRAIYALQLETRTFLEDPSEPLRQQFNCWLDIIEDQLCTDRLNKHLSSSTVLKRQYDELVPDHVSHQLFWQRYLFKKALLEDDIARREVMERRELREKFLAEEQLRWEQEDFATEIELSEEEQIRLLEQYEAETKQRMNSSLSPQKLSSEFVNIEVPIERRNPKFSSYCEGDFLERKDDYFNFEIVNKQTVSGKMKKSDSHNSLDIEVKSSNSSSDGDWEKVTSEDN